MRLRAFPPHQLKAFRLTRDEVGRKYTQTSEVQAGHDHARAAVYLKTWGLLTHLITPASVFSVCFSIILYLDIKRTDVMGAPNP